MAFAAASPRTYSGETVDDQSSKSCSTTKRLDDPRKRPHGPANPILVVVVLPRNHNRQQATPNRTVPLPFPRHRPIPCPYPPTRQLRSSFKNSHKSTFIMWTVFPSGIGFRSKHCRPNKRHRCGAVQTASCGACRQGRSLGNIPFFGVDQTPKYPADKVTPRRIVLLCRQGQGIFGMPFAFATHTVIADIPAFPNGFHSDIVIATSNGISTAIVQAIDDFLKD